MSHLPGIVCARRSTPLHSAAAEKLLLRPHPEKRGTQMQLGRTCTLCRTHGIGASVSIDPLVSQLDVQAGGPFALSHEIKPRARRGQATDAHSISERVRLELRTPNLRETVFIICMMLVEYTPTDHANPCRFHVTVASRADSRADEVAPKFTSRQRGLGQGLHAGWAH